jgi:two-component system, OmpR family, alkaline phosphatase synthesis response regulator PhoP
MSRILIIDDEPDVRDIIRYNLTKEGYDVETAEDGLTGLKKVSEFKPDLIILDMMMPGMDGVEVCHSIRSESKNNQIIICFLSARNEDYSQVAGLESGADDYLAKPVSPRVLVSKVKSLLRRKQERNQMIEESGITIDRERYVVWVDGREVVLPRKEFELLALLSEKPNYVFDRQTILDKVWGNDVVVGDRTIDVHIRKLREKVGEDCIKTVKGVGYKFVSV